MDLEGIMLSEVKSDGERQIPYDFTHVSVEQTNKQKINKQAKQKQTHR